MAEQNMIMTHIQQTMIDLSNNGYEYLEEIGHGAYSIVYLCKSIKYNELFAVKKIDHSKVKDYEIDALVNLHHPNIIQLYETFYGENSLYLVMEYCPNNTLKQKGMLCYKQFIDYSRQILEALKFCHSQTIAHRDIKPENIFIDKYGRIKLADFGLAKKTCQCIISNEKCGSLLYCSPEIIKGQLLYNPFSADIYSLGVTFFYMITGGKPFPIYSKEILKRSIVFGQISFENYEDVDKEIQNMIMKMTSHDPKFRMTIDQILKLPLYTKKESSSQCILVRPLESEKFFTFSYKNPNYCFARKTQTSFALKSFSRKSINLCRPKVMKSIWK